MNKNNKFIKGAAILSIAGLIVKILGAIYRIPLANIIKDEGMGYYQTAYPFYLLLLTISTAGFPIAIAKLVAERRAIGDYRGADKVFRISLVGLFIGGLLSSLFILIKARDIVNSIDNDNAYYSLVALVPALFFVPIMSAFRGMFQGRHNMIPTAISQIAEQGLRLVSGLWLTYSLLDKGIPKAAGGASFGGSAGAILGTITIYIIYLKNRKTMEVEILNSKIHEEYETRDIVMDLLIIAIPITIGSTIIPIMDTIDASLVVRRLQSINYSRDMANELYGQLKGFAQTLINFPQVFSMAIGMSLVPVIAEISSRKNEKELRRQIESGIRITLLIGFPCAFGLFILSYPIANLLYFNNSMETIRSTGEILSYLSFGIIFLTLVQTLTSILQGLGKPLIPVCNLFIGVVIKLFLNYTLISIPSLNIKGAALSTVIAYAVAASLDLVYLIMVFKIRFNIKEIIIKPLISSSLMVIIVKLSYKILLGPIGERLSTIASIGLGVLSYVILLIITGTITNEDMIILPKGRKFNKVISGPSRKKAT